MGFIIFAVLVLVVVALVMSHKDAGAPAYVPPKLEGNRPFPEQNKIKDNLQEYESLILQSPFNMNDWLNVHPGEDNLGPYGEFLTIKQIVKACKETQSFFKILKNLYLDGANGPTEIDVVMIHETGIYVFESKNFSGAICGSAEQKEWTQVLESRGKRHFYNPIWQNRGHISALKRVLGQELNYYSYVVFSERCSLRDVPADSETSFILRRHRLLGNLVEMMNATKPTLSIAQVEALYQELQKFKRNE